jgi:hypothetical protein
LARGVIPKSGIRFSDKITPENSRRLNGAGIFVFVRRQSAA